MFQHFVASIHKPEWLTIYILAVQAAIFVWQSLILRHHGRVMVEQRNLVEKQTRISELQAEISERQRKISEKQVDFTALIGRRWK